MVQERRKPIQVRGKEKVDLILNAAKELIGERGNDAVSMREIAKECGIAPSSIYQYFPDKNAILEAIMAEYYGKFSEIMDSGFSNMVDFPSYAKAVDKGLDQFYKMFKDEPLLATIWSSVQANTVLREMDIQDSNIQDSREKAEAMTKKQCSIFPTLKRKDVYDTNFLFAHMMGSTVRLSLTVGNKEGKRLMKELKQLIILRIESLLVDV